MASKKVLLIDPPMQRFMNFSKGGIPIGLLSLAGQLQQDGYEVKTLDADYFPEGEPYPFMEKIERYQSYLSSLEDRQHPLWREVTDLIDDFSPDVVGISVISTKAKSAKIVAELAKAQGVPRVIVGGPHATLFPEDLGSDPHIDSVVQGEGEFSFNEAMTKKLVSFGRINDLNALPSPARETLVGLDRYKDTSDLGMLMSARGCPNDCNFCCSNALWGTKVRFRSIDNVMEEIDDIHDSFGVDDFYVVDDTFTLNKRRVKAFCAEMEQRPYTWSCLTRMDRVDDEIVEALIDSGCRLVKVGLESGNQNVLNGMNKQITLEKVRKAANIFNDHGLKWIAYVMAGVPDETVKQMDDTMDFVLETRPTYLSPSIFTPYPKTGYVTLNGYHLSPDFAQEEVNHHSLVRIAGNIPEADLRRFMKFADDYNAGKFS
ncbi:B12-binding domain-containing radical SAM protein [Candidatus Woesearchaeota archaeon]|nr:B12-binding domain-containing radical SAM protein [Candidatus Woesearchaeota archaeon]